MARSPSNKRDIEKNRREKAAAKRLRRTDRAEQADGEETVAEATTGSEQDVLATLAALHEQFEAEAIEFEEFEEKRTALLEQLRVE